MMLNKILIYDFDLMLLQKLHNHTMIVWLLDPPTHTSNTRVFFSAVGFTKKTLMGVLAIFSTGTYAGIGMVCRV